MAATCSSRSMAWARPRAATSSADTRSGSTRSTTARSSTRSSTATPPRRSRHSPNQAKRELERLRLTLPAWLPGCSESVTLEQLDAHGLRVRVPGKISARRIGDADGELRLAAVVQLLLFLSRCPDWQLNHPRRADRRGCDGPCTCDLHSVAA